MCMCVHYSAVLTHRRQKRALDILFYQSLFILSSNPLCLLPIWDCHLQSAVRYWLLGSELRPEWLQCAVICWAICPWRFALFLLLACPEWCPHEKLGARVHVDSCSFTCIPLKSSPPLILQQHSGVLTWLVWFSCFSVTWCLEGFGDSGRCWIKWVIFHLSRPSRWPSFYQYSYWKKKEVN